MRRALLIATALVFVPTASHADLSVAEDNKELTHECKDDVVSISANSNKVTLTGRCKVVMIDGNNNTLIIAVAANIAVNGNSNAVSVDRADRIHTPGNENRVAYKGAIDPKNRTRVSNPGNGNKINKVK